MTHGSTLDEVTAERDALQKRVDVATRPPRKVSYTMTTAADRDYQIADEITRLITVDTLTALQASDRIVLAPTATRDGGAVWSIQVLTPGGPARMAMRVELVGGTYAVTILRSGRKRSDPDGIFMHAPTVHADQLGPTIRGGPVRCWTT